MPKKKAAFDSLFVPEEEQPYPILGRGDSRRCQW